MGSLTTLESAIANFENVNPSYNNPGGIMYGSFAQGYGATMAPSGLAVFPDAATGQQAFNDAISHYQGDTLSQLIQGWAPPGAANPNDQNYIDYVSQQTGIPAGSSSFWGSLKSNASDALNWATFGALGKNMLGGKVTGTGIVTVIIGLILIAAGVFSFRQVHDTVITTAKTVAKAAA